jgi:hypothetical protein
MAGIMANSLFREKSLLQGIVTIADNAGFAGANTLKLDDIGDFKVSFPDGVVLLSDGGVTAYYSKVAVKRRGRYKTTRAGEQMPITGSFSVPLFAFTGDLSEDSQTLMDIADWNPTVPVTFIDTRWTPVNGVTVEKPQCKLRFTLKGLTHGESKDHNLDLTQVELKISSLEEAAETGKVMVDFEAWAVLNKD